MHIQEGTNTTLTTCTKMTEEVDRRHGVNGNSSSKSATEDAPGQTSALTATGGRLKFFKGRFSLIYEFSYSLIITAVRLALVHSRPVSKKLESYSCSDNLAQTHLVEPLPIV